MRPYFEKMTPFGKALTDKQKEDNKENIAEIQEVEKQVAEAIEAVKKAGIPEEVLKKRGQTTVWERIEHLIDPGTWSLSTPCIIPNSTKRGRQELLTVLPR